MISILCPTRGRPEQFLEMAESARLTASAVEVIAYVDDDEDLGQFPAWAPGVLRGCIVQGPRLPHSDYWNACAEHARGDILMLCGDDIRFRTPGWDRIVEEAFAAVPDRIVLVHGDDGGDHEQTVGTHPFVHRRWVEAVGYFTPPGFVSDFTDTWLDEVAAALDRKVRVPILTEHLHPLWSKGELDETHRERMARHAEQDPASLYAARADERVRDIERLRAAIAGAA